jgi:hypothetical protein
LAWNIGGNHDIVIALTFTALENAGKLANGMAVKFGFLVDDLFSFIVSLHNIV